MWSNVEMLDHLSIQAADLAASLAFYDQVLAPLGARRVADFGNAVGYGTDRPSLLGRRPETGDGFRESHIAFTAPDRAPSRRSSTPPSRAGAEVLYEPRIWPQYHPVYFAAFVRDPDGNNVEAVCHRPE